MPNDVVLIHRPHLFGNPYSHKDNTLAEFKTKSLNESIEKYKQWFYFCLEHDEKFKIKFDYLVDLNIKGVDINLVCFCSPCKCHGDFIKSEIENASIREMLGL